MTPADLSRTVLRAVRRAVDEGELRVAVPARVVVERPRPGGTGDYATNIALRLAGPAGRPPREVADLLRGRIAAVPGIERVIERVEITGPGFLNFTLAGGGREELVRTVCAQRGRYGYGDAMAGRTVTFRAADELRAQVVTQAVVRLLRTQGARAGVALDGTDVLDGAEVLPVRPLPSGASDVLRQFGADAVVWALLTCDVRERPEFGPGLLVQDESNPLFHVRYAYSRTCALVRHAADLGFGPDTDTGTDTGTDTVTTDTDAESVALLEALSAYPAALEAAAHHRAPDRLARQLVPLADAVLAYQHTVLPLGDEKPSAAHRARLALAEAAGTVLAGGLSLLGISAPEFL
ncbi:ArgS-related anticodon-binding protein NrtL [Streptomyces apocyni]|uniref:ArgS-related anticodon-binding protein NrtL n=1 Tax=Streptomyces apocyni TaxID=2654677 RepID=UPI0012E9F9C3|nr:DALR anticodon-binding domain-containing protein [Streptomyces apocyni]